MAAICGHYELLELLHNAGEEMGQLHFPACSCEECGPYVVVLHLQMIQLMKIIIFLVELPQICKSQTSAFTF